jgi:hypothetical protein
MSEAISGPFPEIRVAYEMLGRIAAEWSEIELLWELVFTCILHEAPRAKIDIILRQFQIGAAQRQMIMAVADVAFAVRSYERTEVGVLYAMTNDVRGWRNAAIHGWYVFDPLNSRIGLRVAPGTRSQPNRLAKEQLDEALPGVLKRIRELSTRLNAFRMHLAQQWLPPDKRVPDLSMPPEMQKALERELPALTRQLRAAKGWPPLA